MSALARAARRMGVSIGDVRRAVERNNELARLAAAPCRECGHPRGEHWRGGCDGVIGVPIDGSELPPCPCRGFAESVSMPSFPDR